MAIVTGRMIFKTFKTLSCELLVECRGRQYYDLAVDLSNQIYDKNWYACREIIKEIKRRMFCDSESNYGIHEVIGKLEQKLSNKLDRVYID